MKKILVLTMGCNKPFFINLEKACRDSWAKPILNKVYPNIEYYTYVGECKESYIDKENRCIYCTSKDGLYDTWEKTYECFKILLSSDIEFDYIFRTNTSTVVNIGLLNAFVQTLNESDKDVVWCGEIYNIGLPCPLIGMLYPRGNSVIFSREIIEVICHYGKYVNKPIDGFADDNIIGSILNTHHILRFENYINYIKSYGFAWYKSLDSADNMFNNTLCMWNNDNDSYDFLKNFISIQIRGYKKNREGEKEKEKLIHISNVINKYKNNYSKELEFIMDYSKHPYYWCPKKGGYIELKY